MDQDQDIAISSFTESKKLVEFLLDLYPIPSVAVGDLADEKARLRIAHELGEAELVEQLAQHFRVGPYAPQEGDDGNL